MFLFKKILKISLNFFILILLFLFNIASTAKASPSSFSHVFPDAINWQFQGKPVAKTYWSPWTPTGIQSGLRYKIGVRFDTGSISIKNKVKVIFSWDSEKAKGGEKLVLNIKAIPLAPDHQKSFEAAFGLHFPNKIQVGLIGISGLGDILPWFDLPVDLWTLVGYIPKYGNIIAQLAQGLGINTSGSDPVPLNSEKSYSDSREVSISLSDLIGEGTKSKVIDKIWSKIPKGKKDFIINAIKLAKNIDDEKAQKIARNLLGNGLDGLASFASLGIIGDPIFKIEGGELEVLIHYWIPGKLTGELPLFFSSTNDVKQIEIPIPVFVTNSDKLFVTVKSIRYFFKLKMIANYKLNLSGLKINIYNEEKVLQAGYVGKQYSESEFKLTIPLFPSDESITNLHVIEGATSAIVRWASPSIKVKGTVKLFKNGQLIAQKTESSYGNVHNVTFLNLTPGTQYKVKVSCVDLNNNIYPEEETTFTTKSEVSNTYTQTYTQKAVYRMYNISVTSGVDYITFKWDTNRKANTQVMISLSPEISGQVGTWYVLKDSGQIAQGYFSSAPGNVKLSTHHSITISGLEPGTKYYYVIHPWFYKNNNPNAGGEVYLNYYGSISTKPAPKLTLKVLDQAGHPIKGITLKITDIYKNNSFQITTDANGEKTFIVRKDYKYKIELTNNPAFEDYSFTYLVLSGNDQDFTVRLHRRPFGGYVYDENGAPLSGVTVKVQGTNFQTVTNSQGYYTFYSLTPGAYTFIYEKSGYEPKTLNINVGRWSYFQASPVRLSIKNSKLNIMVKDSATGQAIPEVNVRIKQGASAEIFSADQSGKVVFSKKLQNSATYIVEGLSSFDKKIVSCQSQQVTLSPGEEKNITINCVRDLQGPTLKYFKIIRSAAGQCIRIIFYPEEEFKYRIIYKTPSGEEKVSPWSNFLLSSQKMVEMCTYNQNLPTGEYKIKLQMKDKYNNLSSTEWKSIELINPEDIGLTLESKGPFSITVKRIVPTISSIGKYVYTLIKEKNIVSRQEFPPLSIKTCTFHYLSPDTLYGVELTVYAKDGSMIGRKFLQVKTDPLPINLDNCKVIPEGATKEDNIKISGSVVLDTNYRPFLKVNVPLDVSINGKSFTTKTISIDTLSKVTYINIPINKGILSPGVNKIEIKAAKVKKTLDLFYYPYDKPSFVIKNSPTTGYVNIPIKIDLEISSKGNKNFLYKNNRKNYRPPLPGIKFSYKPISYTPINIIKIDWGDGNTEYLKVHGGQVSISHTYTLPGTFTIKLEGEMRLLEAFSIPFKSKSVSMKLISKKPSIEVSNMSINQGTLTFTLNCKKGSYPLKSLQINFGDSHGNFSPLSIKETQKIRHFYPMKGNYLVSIKLEDENGQIMQKQFPVRIHTSSIPSSLTSSQLHSYQPFHSTQSSQSSQLQPISQNQRSNPEEGVEIRSIEFDKFLIVSKLTKIKVKLKNKTDKVQECNLVVTSKDWKNIQKLRIPGHSFSYKEISWEPQQSGKTTLFFKLKCGEREVSENRKVEVYKAPDAKLSFIRVIPAKLEVNKIANIEATIENLSSIPLKSCKLLFYLDKKQILQKNFRLTPHQRLIIREKWTPSKSGDFELKGEVICKNDSNTSNNEKEIKIKVSEEKKSIFISKPFLIDRNIYEGRPLEIGFEIKSNFSGRVMIIMNAHITCPDTHFSKNFQNKKVISLKKGRNKVKWTIMKGMKRGVYFLNVEIILENFKIRKNLTTDFEVKHR